MKKLLLPCLGLAIVLFSCGCKKDNAKPAPKYSIIGLWIGTQVPQDGSSNAQLYYSLDIRSDSVILSSGSGNDGNTYYSVGTWHLRADSVLSGTMTVTRSYQDGLSQTFTANFSPSNGTLTNGILTNVGTTYHGAFNLYRVD